MHWTLLRRLFFSLAFCLFSQTATAATIVKVDKAKERAILKLSARDRQDLKTGDAFTLEIEGETIEAEVLGVSGKKVRVKIVYGIDSLAKGQKATLGDSTETTTLGTTSPESDKTSTPHKEGAAHSAKSDFVLSAGGKPHPFAGDLRAPWVMNSPTLYTQSRVHAFINPAQVTRVPSYAFATGLFYDTVKIEDKSDALKLTGNLSTQDYGFTGVINVQSGVHIGLTYGKADTHLKIKGKSDLTGANFQDTKVKVAGNEMDFLFGIPVNDHVSIGAEYAQVSIKSKQDNFDGKSTSTQFLKPGLTYYTSQYEFGLVYAPPIDINETDGSMQIPRTWTMHAQYRLNGGTSVGGEIQHYHLAGVDDDGTDYVDAKLGLELMKSDAASFGMFGIFEQKNYLKKNNANPFSIPHVGLQALYGQRLAPGTDLNAGLTYGKGQAKADDGGVSSKIDVQFVSLFASVSYQPHLQARGGLPRRT